MSVQADKEAERQLRQVIKYMLSRRVENAEYLSVLGNKLRDLGYTLPKGGLKRFCLRYTTEFDFNESPDGTCTISLCSSADSISSDSQSNKVREQGNKLYTVTSLRMHEKVDALARYSPDRAKMLEKRIVAFALDYVQRKGESISMPILGEFCIHSLDIDMKGCLLKFLRDRPHLFTISDLDRQIVNLTENAAHLVGLGRNPYLPNLPLSIQDVQRQEKNSNDNAPERDDQGTIACRKMSYCDAALHPNLPHRENNAIASELYRILIKQDGIGRFQDIEAELKNIAAEEILSTDTESVDDWHLGSLIYKYPHVFHRLGDHVALVERIKPVSKRGHVPGGAHSSLNDEEFPKLS